MGARRVVGGRAHGMLIATTRGELERLYAAPGLDLDFPGEYVDSLRPIGGIDDIRKIDVARLA